MKKILLAAALVLTASAGLLLATAPRPAEACGSVARGGCCKCVGIPAPSPESPAKECCPCP